MKVKPGDDMEEEEEQDMDMDMDMDNVHGHERVIVYCTCSRVRRVKDARERERERGRNTRGTLTYSLLRYSIRREVFIYIINTSRLCVSFFFDILQHIQYHNEIYSFPSHVGDRASSTFFLRRYRMIPKSNRRYSNIYGICL